MVPGRKYTPEDLLNILKRRFWLLIVPAAVFGALSANYIRTVPNVFRAETVVMVLPPRIPENIVQQAQTGRLSDRLPGIRTTITSRTRLERVIQQYDLYPQERRLATMEDVVNMMRSKIDIQLKPGNNAFGVSFLGDDPMKVMKVSDTLASLFIDESLLDRQRQAEGTTQFLDAEVAEAKSKLVEIERRLANWKLAHAGELPSQSEAVIQMMQNTQSSLRDIRAAVARDRDRKLELEGQLYDIEHAPVTALPAPIPAPNESNTPASAPSSAAQQLAQAEAQVAAYEQRGLQDGHPDLAAARRRVRDLSARVAREMASVASGSGSASVAVSPAELTRQRRIAEIRGRIADIDKQIVRNQAEESRLEAVAADAQRRVEAMPSRETEYTELNRDYEIIRNQYNALLTDRQQSQTVENVERRQAGEQFKLLDPARLPEKPISPDRPMGVFMGTMIGLFLGVAIAGLLEFSDKSFKTDEDIAGLLNLPVLAVVPLMKSKVEVRRAMWRTVFISAGLGGVVIGCAAFVARVLVN